MDHQAPAHAMVQSIAEFIKAWNEKTITADKAGEYFENLLSENTGRACVSICVDILEKASAYKAKPSIIHEGHDVAVETLLNINEDKAMYRAVCRRCGLKSRWFPNVGLAKINLDKYGCEVEC